MTICIYSPFPVHRPLRPRSFRQRLEATPPAPAWPDPVKERTKERTKSPTPPQPPFLTRPRCRFVWPHPASHPRGAQEAQDRSSAPLVCQQVPDRESILASSRFLSNFCPQGLLLRSPLLAVLEQVLPGLRLVLAPPACRRIRVLCPLQVLCCAAVPRPELVKSFRQSFRAFCYRCLLLHTTTIKQKDE